MLSFKEYHWGRVFHAVHPVLVDVASDDEPFKLDFGYDPYGYRNLVMDLFGTRQESIYDYLAQQTEFQAAVDTALRLLDYTYDGQGQLTGDGIDEYEYDANGNRVMPGYSTGDNNQLETDGVWNYSYDEAGNLTEKTDGSVIWSYRWDHRNQLVHAERRDATTNAIELTADYTYDVFGNRTSKTVDWDGAGAGAAETLRFALDGWNNLKSRPIGNENWDVWADISGNGTLATSWSAPQKLNHVL